MRTALRYKLATLLVMPSAILWAQQSTPQSTPATPSTTTTPTTQSAPASDLPDSPTAQVKTVLQPTGATVVFDTSMGRITCRFFDQQAPLSVENFIGLAQGTKDWKDPVTHQKMHGKPLYDGTQFHRVIPAFMIQGGDPMGNGMGDPGFYVKNEQDPNLNFDVPGRLAYANSGPDTNGSQFFITEADDDDLDQKYTIFGQCDDAGVLTVKTIARVARDDRDKPLTPVVLSKVTIVPAGKPLPPVPPPPPPPPPPAPAGFGQPQ
jgi:peptidyl-prolyl cis-trans isomerase A (cyclophilin A)